MDEFNWIPDWNAQGNTKANVSKIQFGDGYMQRQTKGMNTLQDTWSLTFNARSREEAIAIRAFLRARYGVISFTWTPPGEEQAKWICDNWSRIEVGNQINNFSLSFEKVYEP